MAFGFMEVHLVSAKGLQDTDFLGNIDPYVVAQYKSQEHESSVARGKGGNPTWNEKFTFKVEYPGNRDQYKLILKIMDKDTFTSDDFLGQAEIYVEELLALGMENGTSQIHPHKYSIITADQSYRGEIQVGITVTRKAENETSRVHFGGWKESEN